MDRISLREPLDQVSLVKQMITNSLSFVYYGNFSNQINDTLIPLVETLIETSGVVRKIRKRAFYIFVECVQNVNRHHYRSAKKPDPASEIFILRENKDRFNIALGNKIHKEKKLLLKEKIDKLNGLSTDALNAHYRMVLEENVLSQKGGAGLGLIEVARKSGSKMKYRFENDHPARSYFTIETNINETDVHYSFPEYESVHDLELLRRFYGSHEMGLILKNRSEYFQKANIDKLILFLDSVARPGFFSRNATERLNKIVRNIEIIRSKNSEDKGIMFHFNIRGKHKHMAIGWSMRMTESHQNFLQQSFLDGSSTDSKHDFHPLVSAIFDLQNDPGKPILCDILRQAGQKKLVIIQIPIHSF